MRKDSHARWLAAAGGGASTAADVAVLALLVEHGAPIAPSAFAGSLCGALVSFVVNKYVAFRDPSPVRAGQLVAFGLVAAATALIMALAMQLVAVDLHVPYLLAKSICAAVVFVLWSYPAQKRVFRPRRSQPALGELPRVLAATHGVDRSARRDAPRPCPSSRRHTAVPA